MPRGRQMPARKPRAPSARLDEGATRANENLDERRTADPQASGVRRLRRSAGSGPDRRPPKTGERVGTRMCQRRGQLRQDLRASGGDSSDAAGVFVEPVANGLPSSAVAPAKESRYEWEKRSAGLDGAERAPRSSQALGQTGATTEKRAGSEIKLQSELDDARRNRRAGNHAEV